MLPTGVAVWPGSANHVAKRVRLPSRSTTTIASLSCGASGGARQSDIILMVAPQRSGVTHTCEVSKLVPTCDIDSAETVVCCGEEFVKLPWKPTNTPIANIAAATVAVAAISLVRWRRQRMVASKDGSSGGDNTGFLDGWS